MEGPRSPAGSITSPASKSRPASPSAAPPKDPGEHADSPMRKRPRLDTGVEPADEPPAMSSERDRIPPPSTSSPDRTVVAASDSSLPSPQQHPPPSRGGATGPLPPLTPSKVTLNLRSAETSPTQQNPPNGPYPTSDKTLHELPDPASATSPAPVNSSEPMQVVVDAPSPSDRSPVVEIIAESEEIDPFANMISDDGVPLDARLLEYFPFASDHGAPEAAAMIAENIAKHSLDVDLLEDVSIWIDQTWLKNVQNLGPSLDTLYTSSQDFWTNLANIYWKFLNRKIHFGNLGRAATTDNVAKRLEQFFEPYIRLCAHIVSVDVSILQDQTLQIDELPDLVSARHIRNLSFLFRLWNQTPLFKVLWDPFRVPAEHIQRRLAIRFLSEDPDGLLQVVEFAKAVSSNVQLAYKFCHDVDFAACAVRHISLYLKSYWLSNHQRDDVQNHYSLFTKACLGLVGNLQQILLEIPLKQNGFAPDFSFRLLDLTRWTLQDVAEFDQAAAWAVVQDEFGDLKNNVPAREAARLLMTCLYLRICWKFVAKGRMELRVLGVANLSADLVNVWREFSPSGARSAYPPFDIIAQWIVKQKLVEYLVSVDSHPQLIARSQDIAGFLMVTHHWTPDVTNAVWNAVDSNPDPRMIAEILEMLSRIVHLAGPNVVSAFCDRIECLQAISLTTAMHHFLEKLKVPLIDILKARNQQSDGDLRKPLLIFIRVICDASVQMSIQPPGPGFGIVNSLHTMALGSLQQLSVAADDYDGRKEIYADCFEEVQKRSQRSMGCLEAILALLDAHEAHDLPFLLSGMDLLRRLSEDFCSFIDEAKRDTPDHGWLVALGPRLKLLTKLLSSGSTSSLPTEVQEKLWSHLVGSDAFNDTSRDQAWSFLVSIVRVCHTSDPLMDRCIHDFILKLSPSLFTRGMFEFVQDAMQYVQRIDPPPPPTEEQAIRIPLADLLWRIILQAPENTVEHPAAILLSQYHLDTPLIQKAPPSTVAATHTVLIERCIIQLKHASGRSPKLYSSELNGKDRDPMTPVPLDGVSEELYFRRTLQFMRRFIHEVRGRPAFRGSEGLPPSPASDSSKTSDIKGEPVVIQYQAFEGGSQKDVKELKIGSLATVAELADRLRQRTGFSDFRAFHSGALFDMVKQANNTVESIHGKGLLLIQNSGARKSSLTSSANLNCTSVAERVLLNHFDTLYDLLDLDQSLSSSLFDFLLAFPPHNRVRDLVLSPDLQLDELFPRGNRIKALYSLRCIKEHLSRQLAGGVDSESFTLKGVQVLTSALTSSHLAPTSSSPNFDAEILGLLVDCLLIFLKQRPLQQSVASCIVNESAIADELFVLLEYAMVPPSSRPSIDCCKVYACLLEASFHSARICQAFISQQHPEELHYWLLVENPNANQRHEIRISIESMCTNTVPTSEAPNRGIVPFFWRVFASLIPKAASKPFQCQEMLATAKTLFPDHHTLCHDETSLLGLLDAWTNILSTYQHSDESPQGRRDAFVLGISRLVSSCVSFLKSFKKPINGNRLTQILFQRYLFPPVAREITEDMETYQDSGSPILCGDTRRELYNLVLALCENHARYDWLVRECTNLLINEEKDPTSWGQDISRWMRTSTGYSGLRNLTNTCYMNSLMTQLFMNSKFRRFMLSVPISGSRGSQKLLVETQRLLAYMQNSSNKYAETWPFAEAIQPYDAEHIDISVQMDVDEFYNLLFDRWECQMPSPETKQEFRSLYGGQLVTQIKSKDCEHVSETIEPFMTIQCEVRGKGNLSESLHAYVEGDAMEGDNKYKCESCGGRFVNAVKRSCVKNMPDNLIFHLKRFDFDLTTLDRHKINDEFGFPEQIDMREFCVDYLNDPASAPSADLFQLVGVLVHNGTAESGHYYSYIRLPSATTDFHASTWAEFNDIEVSEFDQTSIPEQCFGGNAVHGEMIFQKHYNAYMLFYRRVSAIKADTEAAIGVQRKGPSRFPTSPDLEAEIVRENENLARRFCLFESTHAHFLRSLVSKLRDSNWGACSATHEFERGVCEMMVQHSSRVLSRVREVPELEPTISVLLRIVSSCGECANYTLSLLAQNADIAQDVLLVCPSSKARNIWGRLILTLLQNVKRMDPQTYGIEAEPDEFDVSNIYDHEDGTLLDRTFESGTFLIVVRCLEDMIPHLGRFIRSWDDYFGLWAEIINLGITELGALLSHGLFTDFLVLLELPENKRLVNGKFQITHDYILRYKRSIPRIGLVKAIRGFFARVNPCFYADDSDNPASRLESFNPEIQRFAVNSTEHEIIHQINPKGQLGFLNRILDGWDIGDGESSAPADIVRDLLQCCLWDSFGHQGRETIHRVGESLASILSEYHTLFSKGILSACLVFCRSCTNIQPALQILEEACASVESMKEQKREPQRNTQGIYVDFGPQGGSYYLDFFQSLCEMEDANCSLVKGESPYIFYVIDRASIWAPPLLLYDMKPVRSATVNLLEHLIFNKYPYHLVEHPITAETEIGELDALRILANRALFDSCVANIQRAGQLHLPSSFIQATTAVLTQCASFCDKLCREESQVMQLLQMRLDRYHIQNDIGTSPNLADSSRKIVQRWNDLEPKLRDWQYDSEGDEAISDTEWGSSFDDLSDAVTDA